MQTLSSHALLAPLALALLAAPVADNPNNAGSGDGSSKPSNAGGKKR